MSRESNTARTRVMGLGARTRGENPVPNDTFIKTFWGPEIEAMGSNGDPSLRKLRDSDTNNDTQRQ